MSHRVRLGFVLILGLVVVPSWEPAAVQAVDKDVIDRTILRGVQALRGMQMADGTWNHSYTLGATALAGLALLESGVPADDVAIVRAAGAIRNGSISSRNTYSLSLSILFLDRLGKPADIPFITAMTIRLLEGQSAVGGWAYETAPLDDSQETILLGAGLRQAEKQPKKEGDNDTPAGFKDLSPWVKARLAQVPARRAAHANQATTPDNSNTQFAILGLWVGRRHGIPVDGALLQAEAYFRATQGADGGWGYNVMAQGALGGLPAFAPPIGPMAVAGMGMGGSLPTMTCAGLLSLGLGYGVRNDQVGKAREQAADGGEALKGKLAAIPVDPNKDRSVVAALKLLGTAVGQPIGGVIPPGALAPGVMAPGLGGIRGGGPQAAGKLYYFLWSLERVAVAFDLDTVGNKDWFQWGVEVLVAHQDAQGAWSDGEYGTGGADTAFALLFLNRANLLRDLTRSLKGKIKDPDRVQLAGAGIGTSRAVKKPMVDGGPPPASPVQLATTGKAGSLTERLVSQLVGGTETEQKTALETLRDTKGTEYTEALAAGIRKLEGPARKAAREALAERMARMSSATLADKLDDEDQEIRRAALLASALKEDRTNVPKMIDLLLDPEPIVSRAAHAALKDLTKKDFGPEPEASRAARTKAAAAWRSWWQKQSK